MLFFFVHSLHSVINSRKKIQAVAVLFASTATVTRYELIQKSSTSTIQRVGAAPHGGHTSAGANVQYVLYSIMTGML